MNMGFQKQNTHAVEETPKDYFDLHQDPIEEEKEIFMRVQQLQKSKSLSNLQSLAQQDVKFKDIPSV